MGYVYMADLVGSAPKSNLNPIGIYDGPRVGDEFREWNAMSGAGRKHKRLQRAIAAVASPSGAQSAPAPGEDDEDAMGQTTFVDPPQDLDVLYMDDLGSFGTRRHQRGRKGRNSGRKGSNSGRCRMVCDEDQPQSDQPQSDQPQSSAAVVSKTGKGAMSDWGDGEASMELSPEAAFGIGDEMGYGSAYGMGQVLNLGIAQRLAGEAIQAIEFRSQVTPPVIIDKPFGTGVVPPPQVQGGTPMSRAFMERIAKPAVYLRLTGGAVVPMEPYGKPVNDYTGLMLLGTAATAAVSVFVGIKIGQKLFCKK